MNLLERTKLQLLRHRIFPNKLFGQNFIVEPSIFQYMVSYASLGQNDVVLDIGAGLGFLTRFLANNCKSVLAVESDTRLVEILREQFQDLPNIKIIEGNVLKMQLPPFNKVVSIPPYHISSRLLLWLFNKNFDCAILVFQKEFANRLIAPIGSEDYGWLTVFTYYHATVEILEAAPKWMFYPQPKVDSVIIRLKRRRPPPFKLKNEASFRQMVQSLFAERNRKVRNAIMPFMKGMRALTAENAVTLADTLPFSVKRVRELAPKDFGALANALSNQDSVL